MKDKWHNFALQHKTIAQFLVFFMVSNGITILQLVMMPICKFFLGKTELLDVNFLFGQIGTNIDGSPYYIFNYAAGALNDGGGGGLAYFFAVQFTMAIAQIINFFLQRKVTFQYTGNIWKAAKWYMIAYVLITLGAAAAQGLYKVPVYHLLIQTLQLGKTGETIADFISMIINCVISFWVFFPILKIIFRENSTSNVHVVKEQL